jgi:hypothetical protein
LEKQNAYKHQDGETNTVNKTPITIRNNFPNFSVFSKLAIEEAMVKKHQRNYCGEQ